MQDDILTDIRDAVDTALKDGQTLAEFKKNLEPTLRKKGWWGKKEMEGPDGKQLVQLGSPRRLRTIYNTNMRTAYSAGRYKEFMDNIEDRPYWQYVAMSDARPKHAALAGVYRADDPFWDTFWPPNDWGCRCRVRALSKKNVEDRGHEVIDTTGKIKQWPDPADKTKTIGAYVDAESGEIVKCGAGWSYNPGKNSLAWAENNSLGKVVKGQKSYRNYGRPSDSAFPYDQFEDPGILADADTLEAAVQQTADALGFKKGEEFIFIKTADKDRVMVRKNKLQHLVEKRNEHRERYANFIRATLENPYEVWLTEFERGQAKQYIGIFPGNEGLLVSVQVSHDGSLLWNIIPGGKGKLNNKRKGTLLYGK